jgi:hypothetical protein
MFHNRGRSSSGERRQLRAAFLDFVTNLIVKIEDDLKDHNLDALVEDCNQLKAVVEKEQKSSKTRPQANQQSLQVPPSRPRPT